jgi:hypothetical protein
MAPRRDTVDKAKRIEDILRADPELSNAAIAERTGFSSHYVQQVRLKLGLVIPRVSISKRDEVTPDRFPLNFRGRLRKR